MVRLSSEIQKDITYKNNLYKISVKTPTQINIKRYKECKRLVSKRIKQERRHYYNIQLAESQKEPKLYWNTIKEIIGRANSYPYPDYFIVNDHPMNDSKVIANQFNEFFINVGPQLENKMADSSITHTHYLEESNQHSIFIEPTTEDEINGVFKILKNSAAGYDGYNRTIIAIIFHIVLKPLVHIINLSLLSGTVPKEIKLAKVKPLFKGDNPHLLNNYRPISILPILSKFFEKIMHKRIYRFLNSHNYLYNFQFGFREKHSTELALVALNHTITSSFNNNQIILGIFLDFSKAFDTVNFKILLDKLKFYGIRGTPLKWLENYLTHRWQYINFDNADSDKGITKMGVPQGSILGPLLFLIYINDLFKVSLKSNPIMYADDSSLFFCSSNLESLINIANSEMEKIHEWLKANKLSLNIKKTKYMIFSKKLKIPNPLVPLQINNYPIERGEKVKFLGFILDENLSWKAHVNYITTKICKMIGLFIKLRNTLHTNTLRNLYFSFIYTYLKNGIMVWGSAAATHISILEKCQKKVIRIIASSSRLAHTEPLFRQLNILTVNKMYKLQIAVFMYRVHHQLYPPVILHFFERVNQDRTRQKHHFNVPKATTMSYEKSIVIQGPKLYNLLYNKVNINCSLATYKKCVCSFMECQDEL